MKIPQIIGINWLNSKPLSPDDLKNKIVLIDFWTYSCANCLRTLPHIKNWWKKYKDEGLLIIGVHTPEFDFEKKTENVERAVKKLGIEWPVVMDNEYANWMNFANHYWPAKYLADRSGNIVFTHFGEGNYKETENLIRDLLRPKINRTQSPRIVDTEHRHGEVCFRATPELYCGYLRGRLANPEGFTYDSLAQYLHPAFIAPDSFALSGNFIAAPQYVQSAAEGSSLILNFQAFEVNLVMEPVGKKSSVEVKFNGEKIDSKLKGESISRSSQVIIKEPRLYNLLRSKNPAKGLMKITSLRGDFRAYAFTFSGCGDQTDG